MSHEDEIALQEQDDLEYQRWLKSTPQYWSELTEEKTARAISSRGLQRCMASGVIITKEQPEMYNDNPCRRCGGEPMVTHPTWAPYNKGLCFRCNGTGKDPVPSRKTVQAETILLFESLGVRQLPEKAKKRAHLIFNAYVEGVMAQKETSTSGALRALQTLLQENRCLTGRAMEICACVRSQGLPDASLHLSESAVAHLGMQEKFKW